MSMLGNITTMDILNSESKFWKTG